MLFALRATCPRLENFRLFYTSRQSLGSYGRRYIKSSSVSERRNQSLDVRVGGSGSVRIDISLPAEASSSSTGPVLVHIPNGHWYHSTHSKSPISGVTGASSILSTLISADTTLITINHRLSPVRSGHDFRFPIPIHDVSVAWSYITSQIRPLNLDNNEGEKKRKISLIGSRIGGALAAMLVLTNPNDIHAIAMIEPMVNWVSLDETSKIAVPAQTGSITALSSSATSHTRKKQAKNLENAESIASAAQDLIRLRSSLFRNPASYFDPFASPMLFLRAPGRDTPLDGTQTEVKPVEPEISDDKEMSDQEYHSSFGPYDDDWHQHADEGSTFTAHDTTPESSQTESLTSSTGSSTSTSPPPRRRKVLYRWPRIGIPEDVILPHVKVFVQHPGVDDGHAALLRAQGIELVDLMRRACFFGREKGFAEERVDLGYIDGFKVENTSEHGLEQCVEWLQETFEQD